MFYCFTAPCIRLCLDSACWPVGALFELDTLLTYFKGCLSLTLSWYMRGVRECVFTTWFYTHLKYLSNIFVSCPRDLGRVKMANGQPLGAHPWWWPWSLVCPDHRVFIKRGNKTRGHTNTRPGPWHRTPVTRDIYNGYCLHRPPAHFYPSIVIQIGKTIPTRPTKNFRPIIKCLTSLDWTVIRILRDGWCRMEPDWGAQPSDQWPGDLVRAPGTNERNVNVWAARIVFQDTSSLRERESGADGEMLLLLLPPVSQI